MTILLNQTNFTHGELAPVTLARYDLEVYRKAALKLRNVVVIPQGGVKRRFGTKYLLELDTTTNNFMLVDFEYEEGVSYLLLFIENELRIYYQDQLVATLTTPYNGSIFQKLELKYTQFEQTMIFVHPDYQPRELIRTSEHGGWELNLIEFKHYFTYDFERNYDDISFKFNNVNVGDGRTLTADAPIFTPEYEGGRFEGDGPDGLSDGTARLVTYISPTQMEATIISTFDSSYGSFQSGKNVQLSVPAWSDARGWPLTATFLGGRLVFGGSKSLPSTIFMSVTYDKYNFDEGRLNPDNAIFQTLNSNKANTIKHIVSSSTLQIFTTHSEFSIFSGDNRAITPHSIYASQQSTYGTTNCPPQLLNNQTFYIKRGGKGVKTFIYDNGVQAYQSLEASKLSPHLIRNPIDSAVFEGSFRDDANYLILINEDGTLALYQVSLEERVSAWTLSETEGKFKRICAVDDDIYFIVEREINNETKYYLEKMDWDLYMDCTYINTYATPTDVITGLNYLEGETVKVLGDGYVLNDKVVENGEIQLEYEVSEVKVGLHYIPLISALPVSIALQMGSIAYINKKIYTIYVDYYESAGIYINDVLIPFRKFGQILPYPPAIPQTGVYEHVNYGKWTRGQPVEITQKDPLPMTILALGYKLDVRL